MTIADAKQAAALVGLASLTAFWLWRARGGALEAKRNAMLLLMLLFGFAFVGAAGIDGPAGWFELAGVVILCWTGLLYQRRLAQADPGSRTQAGAGRQGHQERPERPQPGGEQPGQQPPEQQAAPPVRTPELERGSRAWALHELGVKEGATAGEVNARYRELMRSAHPDRGGDTSFAQDLNLARKVLLG